MASWSGWEQQLLRALGVPVTKTNVSSLAEWQRREGGTAAFNPLNTTQPAPGAGNYNSVGVRNYRSLQQGLNATVRTLRNGRYDDILQALGSNQPLGSQQSLGVWGTGTWSGKNKGAPAAAPAPVSPSPTGLTGSPAPPAYTMRDAALEGLGALASGTYDPVVGLAALRRAAEATAQATTITKSQQNYGTMANPVVGPKGSKFGAKAARMVQDYLGTPYVWGGSKPGGFDCSGLLQWVWGKLGVKIPRVTYDQIKAGSRVNRGQLRPGDAVFFGSKSDPHHVGMYIGGGQFIEAPRTGLNVRISNLAGRRDYLTARRYA